MPGPLRVDPQGYETTSCVDMDIKHIEKISVVGVSELAVPEKILLVGWRRDMDDLIEEIDEAVAPGSEVTIFSDIPLVDREGLLKEGGLDLITLRNIDLVQVCGNATSRRDLELLPLLCYNSVLVLAEARLEGSAEIADTLRADSRSLTSLLLIRDIIKKQREQASAEAAVVGPQKLLPGWQVRSTGRDKRPGSLSSPFSLLPPPARLSASPPPQGARGQGHRQHVLLAQRHGGGTVGRPGGTSSGDPRR